MTFPHTNLRSLIATLILLIYCSSTVRFDLITHRTTEITPPTMATPRPPQHPRDLLQCTSLLATTTDDCNSHPHGTTTPRPPVLQLRNHRLSQLTSSRFLTSLQEQYTPLYTGVHLPHPRKPTSRGINLQQLLPSSESNTMPTSSRQQTPQPKTRTSKAKQTTIPKSTTRTMPPKKTTNTLPSPSIQANKSNDPPLPQDSDELNQIINDINNPKPVSYTHLTLPTTSRV